MALTGLLAYPSLRTATCLKSSTGSYCFADAITNSTSDEDAYVYYLGVGNKLPSTTRMTCNQCLKDVVGVFGAAAANRTAPVAAVYAEGAGVVNGVCGKGWVNETVPSALTGGTSGKGYGGIAGTLVAVLVGVVMVLM
jgi:selenophosphate synthase